MQPHDTPIPNGYCHCGCGQKTQIAKLTDNRYGSTKGEPQKFVHNHHTSRPLAERFWEKVDKRGPDECWNWTASNTKGYGSIGANGKLHRATRIGWEMLNGPIPDGLWVLHKCDNPFCCNPSHWFLGSPADNTRDMMAKGRQNRKGHQAKGESQWQAKLTSDKVIEIRKRASDGEKITAIARAYGVAHTTIHKIVNRLAWRHIP